MKYRERKNDVLSDFRVNKWLPKELVYLFRIITKYWWFITLLAGGIYFRSTFYEFLKGNGIKMPGLPTSTPFETTFTLLVESFRQVTSWGTKKDTEYIQAQNERINDFKDAKMRAEKERDVCYNQRDELRENQTSSTINYSDLTKDHSNCQNQLQGIQDTMGNIVYRSVQSLFHNFWKETKLPYPANELVDDAIKSTMKTQFSVEDLSKTSRLKK
jgi:hypothetical protein